MLRKNRLLLLIGTIAGLVIVSLALMAFMPRDTGLQFSATRLDGTPIELRQYRGQVVLLNFWATWCGPCRAEMGLLQAAYEHYREQGFVILAINDEESPAQIQPFVDGLGLTFPIVLDEDASLQRQFGIMGYPTSILIGRDGSVISTYYGAFRPDDLTATIESAFSKRVHSVLGARVGFVRPQLKVRAIPKDGQRTEGAIADVWPSNCSVLTGF